MEETIKGIIIRTVDYKEKDKLLTIATFDKGLILINAKGVRSSNAKLKSYAQILSFGEFSITKTRAGYILSGANIEEMFYNCWTNTFKYSACMIILELIEKLASRQQEINNELILMLRCLKEINYTDNYPLQYTLLFMCKIVAFLGIDYEITKEQTPKIYELINNFVYKKDEVIDESYDKNLINDAIKILTLLLRNENNINLKVVAKVFITT